MVFKNSAVWQISTEALIKHLEGLTASDAIYWDSRELKKTGRKFQSQPWSLWRKVTKDDAGKWVFVEEAAPQQQQAQPVAQEDTPAEKDAFLTRAVTNEHKVTYIPLTSEESNLPQSGSWAVVEVDTASNLIIGQAILDWDGAANFAKLLKETIEPKKSDNISLYLVYWANTPAAFDVMPLHTNAQINKAAARLYRYNKEFWADSSAPTTDTPWE